MSKNLKSKTVISVGWNMAEMFSLYFVRFFIGIILARLLTPNDFGLIGMVTIFFSFSEVFIAAGFGQALIQKKKITKDDTNTAFAINFALGILIYIILFICSPAISRFFNQPQLIELIRVLALVIVIHSLNMVQYSLVRKELEFKKKSIISVIAVVISGVAGIVAALEGMGVWSLVVLQMTNATLTCIMFHATSSWKLTLSFSKASFNKLFNYGSWLLIVNLSESLFNSFYRFIIGKSFSSTDLGLYDRATQLQSMVSDNVAQSVGSVAFPVYSKIQDNTSELKNTSVKFVVYTSFIMLPLLSILYVVSDSFVLLILTEKWLAIVPLLKYLCIAGIFVPVYKFLPPLLESSGHAKHAWILSTLILILRIINVSISINYGLKGIIIGEIFVQLISLTVISLVIRKAIKFNYLVVFYGMRWILFITIIATLCGSFIYNLLELPVLQLCVTPFIIIALYIILSFIFCKNIVSSLLSTILKIIKKQ